jgi:hypothetical protein
MDSGPWAGALHRGVSCIWIGLCRAAATLLAYSAGSTTIPCCNIPCCNSTGWCKASCCNSTGWWCDPALNARSVAAARQRPARPTYAPRSAYAVSTILKPARSWLSCSAAFAIAPAVPSLSARPNPVDPFSFVSAEPAVCISRYRFIYNSTYLIL